MILLGPLKQICRHMFVNMTVYKILLVRSIGIGGFAVYCFFQPLLISAWDTVVWEGNGDIYGADISDLDNIEIFTICDDKAGQYDPAIFEETVVWTDQRNDDGDIYGASILDMKDINPVPVIKKSGTQKQPALDTDFLVYVSSGGFLKMNTSQIEVCRLTEFPKTSKVTLMKKYKGERPAVNQGTILWRDSGTPQGVRIRPFVEKRVDPKACAMED